MEPQGTCILAGVTALARGHLSNGAGRSAQSVFGVGCSAQFLNYTQALMLISAACLGLSVGVGVSDDILALLE